MFRAFAKKYFQKNFSNEKIFSRASTKKINVINNRKIGQLTKTTADFEK
jgi:hypothetical protein